MGMPAKMNRMFLVCCALALSMLNGKSVHAQQPAPSGSDRAAFAARRFPQPVRVGDLVERRVLEPVESRTVLGRVTGVVRLNNGQDAIVMKYGGFLGFGSRSIAVSTDAVVLLGSELEVLDFTPQQLDAFPTFDAAGSIPLAADDVIRMGLAHPSH